MYSTCPLRPECAAWRYGDQFGRRRRRWLLVAGGAVTVASTALIAGSGLGLFSVGGLWQVVNLGNAITTNSPSSSAPGVMRRG